jgi:hypothetical protein
MADQQKMRGEELETKRCHGILCGFGLREWLSVLLVIAGVVATFSSVQTQLQNNTYRLNLLENNFVPRAEHEAKEAEHQKRETEWSQRLDRIESKLDELLVRRQR